MLPSAWDFGYALVLGWVSLVVAEQIKSEDGGMMYYDAVKAAFGCFPLDPPGHLVVGDYVRITWGGKVHQLGNLEKLLGIEIEFDENSSDIEYMSNSVSKAGLSGSAPVGAEAKISFSNTPGLYLKGTRRVRRARNLDAVFGAVSRAQVEWSFRNRIVVETHFVDGAELYCSGGTTAEMKATYGPNGGVVSIDAGAALEHRSLLHMPNVTGTIAFSPVRLVFGFALPASSPDRRGYVGRELDVNDPDEYEPDEKDDVN